MLWRTALAWNGIRESLSGILQALSVILVTGTTDKVFLSIIMIIIAKNKYPLYYHERSLTTIMGGVSHTPPRLQRAQFLFVSLLQRCCYGYLFIS